MGQVLGAGIHKFQCDKPVRCLGKDAEQALGKVKASKDTDLGSFHI